MTYEEHFIHNIQISLWPTCIQNLTCLAWMVH